MALYSDKVMDTMSASAPSWLLAVIIIGTLAITAFSGWIGGKLLKKQFEEAGITGWLAERYPGVDCGWTPERRYYCSCCVSFLP